MTPPPCSLCPATLSSSTDTRRSSSGSSFTALDSMLGSTSTSFDRSRRALASTAAAVASAGTSTSTAAALSRRAALVPSRRLLTTSVSRSSYHPPSSGALTTPLGPPGGQSLPAHWCPLPRPPLLARQNPSRLRQRQRPAARRPAARRLPLRRSHSGGEARSHSPSSSAYTLRASPSRC